MLFLQPFARAIDLQSGAIDQNMNRPVSHMLPVVASG